MKTEIDNNIIMVDDNDAQIGLTTKLIAHAEGLLHRAFSIFIFRTINGKLEVLLQQRAEEKYHSGGLWTNTCCSHAKPDETLEQTAVARLKEEFGFSTKLHKVGKFKYRSEVSNNLIEHEYDHVFIGSYANEQLMPDKNEINSWEWVPIPDLIKSLDTHPEHYTVWLKPSLILAIKNKKIAMI